MTFREACQLQVELVVENTVGWRAWGNLSCCCGRASTCESPFSFTMQQDLSNLTREAQYLGRIFDHTDGELVL